MSHKLAVAITTIATVCMLIAVLALTTAVSLARSNGEARHDAQVAVSPELVSQVGGSLWEVAVTGTVALVNAGPNLYALDISNPTSPTVLGTVPIPGAQGIAIQGRYAFVAASSPALRVVDIADPAHLLEVGQYSFSGSAQNIFVAGNYAYLAVGTQVHIVSILTPTVPIGISIYDTAAYVSAAKVANGLIYIANGYNGVRIVSATNPYSPTEVGTYLTPNYAGDIDISSTLAYVADSDSGSVQILNISQPFSPTFVGAYTGAPNDYSDRLRVNGSVLYVTDDGAGLRALDVSNPALPTQLGKLTTGFAWPYGLTVVGNSVYVGDPATGFHIVNVSNPAAPTRTGQYLPPPPGFNEFGALARQGNLTYVGDATGLHIFDLADPVTPTQLGSYPVNGPVRSVVVSGPYAYLGQSTGSSRLQVVDITDPASPTLVGGYTYSGEFRDVATAGNRVYALQRYRLDILDVSTPTTPTVFGSFTSLNNARAVVGSGTYIYVVENNNGLRILNAADAGTPLQIALYDTPGIAQDVALAGHYAYIADGAGGLRILDVANPVSPTLMAAYTGTFQITSVAVTGTTAYVVDNARRIRAIDVSDPARPVELTSFGTAQGLALSADLIHAATWTRGLETWRIKDTAYHVYLPLVVRSN